MHSTFLRRHGLTVIAAAVSSCSIWFALFLRGKRGNPIREGITTLLGYDGRAALERLLTAIGLPLASGLLIVFGTRILCHLCSAAANQLGVKSKWLTKSADEVVTTSSITCTVSLFSCVYLIWSIGWEWDQAFVSVYGKNARGSLQWDQLSMDVAGVLVAIVFASLISRHYRQRTRLEATTGLSTSALPITQ